MTLPVVFRRIAQAEFDAAIAWYVSHSQVLGGDFVTQVQKVLDIVANDPERYPIADGDVREALVSRFPYCVYYRVRPDRVLIVAVFHTSRDPAIWKGRK